MAAFELGESAIGEAGSGGDAGRPAPSEGCRAPAEPTVEDRAKATIWVVQHIQQLPTLPSIVMQAMEVISDTGSSARDLASIVSYDQSISARVLRVANSAFYGLCRQVSTVFDAVMILGFTSVQSLILTTSVMHLTKPVRCGDLDREQFWQHSVACGIAALALADKIHYPRPADVFTAGILHDMGRIVMDQHLRDGFRRVLRLMGEKQVHSTVAEREVLGLDHACLGAHLARAWNLPFRLADTISYHHNPLAAEEDILSASLVSLADAYCTENRLYSGFQDTCMSLDPAVYEEVGVSQESLASVLPPFEVIAARARSFVSCAEGNVP